MAENRADLIGKSTAREVQADCFKKNAESR
jgi:hypothetical protein